MHLAINIPVVGMHQLKAKTQVEREPNYTHNNYTHNNLQTQHYTGGMAYIVPSQQAGCHVTM
jgi:hypothetical protein